MKVAITTWHDGPNPGTYFQLFGLYSYIKERGHSVKVVNYMRGNSSDFIPRGIRFFFTDFFGRLRNKLKNRMRDKKYKNADIPYRDILSRRDELFKNAYDQMDFTTRVVTDEDFNKLNDHFDAFVVGSDQVWNPTALNRRYFLDYVHDDKIKAAYGPSVGKGVVLPYQRKQYKKYLKDFNYIAVRENFLKSMLEKELPVKVEHLLDPSQLIPRDVYLKNAIMPENFDNSQKYLLCYFFPRTEELREQVRRYAKEKGLRIVMMAMTNQDFTFEGVEIVTPSPWEYIWLIANATTIFTSSFHCTIFSILLNKDFYVFEYPIQNKASDISLRYKEQLETYGIMHRLVKVGEFLSSDNEKVIDYESVNKIFDSRLKESKDFLNQFV